MRKFGKIDLLDNAWGNIVLLYLGCKIKEIECGTINDLTNKVILAGATGKKLTFATVEDVFESQELMDFVQDYIYERMNFFLYNEGTLNTNIMELCSNWQHEKSLFFDLINIIFPSDFLDELDDGDVWLALSRGVSVKTGTHSYMYYTPDFCPAYRFQALFEKAVRDYENIINS